MKFKKALVATAIMTACMCALIAIAGCSSPSDSSSQAKPEEAAPTQTAPANDPQAVETPSKADQEAAAKQAAIENAKDLGFQVFDGTIHVCTDEELIKLQGKDIDPAAFGQPGTFAVIVFDSPTDVIGMGADGSGERTETANMMGLASSTQYGSSGDIDTWKALDGKRATVAAQARDIWFPSDVSLPIGEPSTSEAKVIE